MDKQELRRLAREVEYASSDYHREDELPELAHQLAQAVLEWFGPAEVGDRVRILELGPYDRKMFAGLVGLAGTISTIDQYDDELPYKVKGLEDNEYGESSFWVAKVERVEAPDTPEQIVNQLRDGVIGECFHTHKGDQPE